MAIQYRHIAMWNGIKNVLQVSRTNRAYIASPFMYILAPILVVHLDKVRVFTLITDQRCSNGNLLKAHCARIESRKEEYCSKGLYYDGLYISVVTLRKYGRCTHAIYPVLSPEDGVTSRGLRCKAIHLPAQNISALGNVPFN